MAPYGVGHEDRSSSKQVGHIATGIDIIAIIVFAILSGVDLPRHARPLSIVTSSFETSRQTTDGVASLNVTHTTSEAYSIGSDNTLMMAAVVGEYYTVSTVRTGIEIEGAEIDPCGTTHLLIDTELGRNALMPDDVVGIVDAAPDGLVAHIDGIAPCLWDGGLPGDGALLSAFSSNLSPTGCSCTEWILVVKIGTSMIGETHGVGSLPEMCTTDLMVAQWRVVVDNHLMALPIALARCEHDGASALKHRDEIGYHDGLSEEVLGGTEEFWALPAPFTFVDVVVSSVTCPEAEVAVLQAVSNLIG